MLGLIFAILAFLLAAVYANGQVHDDHIRYKMAPNVQFVGDDIAQGLVAYAANPLWQCTDCQPSATTTIALSSFSAALGTKPDLIVFIIGTYDLVPVTGQPTWQIACGIMSVTCNNLAAMVSQALAANCQVIVGTIPPWGNGPVSTQLDPGSIVPGLVPKWNQHLTSSYGASALTASTIPVIDFDTALAQQVPESGSGPDIDGPYIASYTNNGIDPNSTGYAIMVQLVLQQINAMRFYRHNNQ